MSAGTPSRDSPGMASLLAKLETQLQTAGSAMARIAELVRGLRQRHASLVAQVQALPGNAP
jgi:hypothetical protein